MNLLITGFTSEQPDMPTMFGRNKSDKAENSFSKQLVNLISGGFEGETLSLNPEQIKAEIKAFKESLLADSEAIDFGNVSFMGNISSKLLELIGSDFDELLQNIDANFDQLANFMQQFSSIDSPNLPIIEEIKNIFSEIKTLINSQIDNPAKPETIPLIREQIFELKNALSSLKESLPSEFEKLNPQQRELFSKLENNINRQLSNLENKLSQDFAEKIKPLISNSEFNQILNQQTEGKEIKIEVSKAQQNAPTSLQTEDKDLKVEIRKINENQISENEKANIEKLNNIKTTSSNQFNQNGDNQTQNTNSPMTNNAESKIEIKNIQTPTFEKIFGEKLEAPINNTFTNVKMEQFQNITQKMATTISPDGTTGAKLTLSPKSLGTVFVELTMNDNVLTMKITAENSDAAKAIEKQLGALKERLGSQGIQTESVQVRVNPSSEQNLTSSYENQQKNSGEEAKERRNLIFSGNKQNRNRAENSELKDESERLNSGSGYLIEKYI